MNNSALPQVSPPVSPPSPLSQPWENLHVTEIKPQAGEGTCHSDDEHTLFLSLAPRPVRLLHIQGGKTHSGLYGKGDLLITPAQMPIFARWDSDDHYLQIRLKAKFLHNVATETLTQDADQLELFPEFRTRNPQIEALGVMLLSEFEQGQVGNQLYVDSLANLLAVNLLRQHTTTQPKLPIYEGGLPQRQLLQVLDYVDAHLAHEIKLADLAQLLDMSQFHFSRLFKQSLGVSPYQYLLQQRVERAKLLLKQTDQSIMDIAMQCGFSSHSHLSKQFRQFMGMSPKVYRRSLS